MVMPLFDWFTGSISINDARSLVSPGLVTSLIADRAGKFLVILVELLLMAMGTINSLSPPVLAYMSVN